jgi:hypothetical protein
MAAYRMGSKGDETARIQERLKQKGLYRGPVDGDFGGGTEAAIKVFQKSKGLTVDGVVGPLTWNALFAEPIAEPSLKSKPLAHQCLALTGAFETGKGIPDSFAGVSGDFDGQGMSFGVLQWNVGQGSLQPLLREMMDNHPAIVREIFQADYNVLMAALNSDREELLAFVRSIQHPLHHFLYEPWRGMFKSLGRTEEFQVIEVRNASQIFQATLAYCVDYGLWSARAVALMFDIRVQNGSIRDLVRTRIMKDFDAIAADLPDAEREIEKMRIVANRRAEAANPAWIEDVRARKLCIANGLGVVHGIPYDIEGQFGIGLTRFDIAPGLGGK